MNLRNTFHSAVGMLAALGLVGCSDDGNTGVNGPDSVDNLAGSTAFVAILNPVVNEGHSPGAPAIMGTEREGVAVKATPGEADTSISGIAVVGTGVGDGSEEDCAWSWVDAGARTSERSG